VPKKKPKNNQKKNRTKRNRKIISNEGRRNKKNRSRKNNKFLFCFVLKKNKRETKQRKANNKTEVKKTKQVI